MGSSKRSKIGWVVAGVGCIPLTKGKVAFVSEHRLPYLSQFHWCCSGPSNRLYAVRREGNRFIRMHREIVGLENADLFVDHIDHNSLNNQDKNLRVCSNQQNSWNARLSPLNTTGYKGVSWDKEKQKYSSFLKRDGKHIFLGRYDNPLDAANAYKKAAEKHFGEFAYAP